MAKLPPTFSFKPRGKRFQATTSGDYSSTTWRKLRARRIAEEPLCRHCKAKGYIERATQVDHIVPKIDGGKDEWDNTQSLCGPCHTLKTNAENTQRRRPSFL